MTLIIEDGSIVTNANSYVTVVELAAYALLRGTDLSGLNEAQTEALIIKAMDYLESKRGQYKGSRVSSDQELQWPRLGVYDVDLQGELYPHDAIPRELKYAQMSLAIEANSHDLQPNRLRSDKGQVIKEKIDGAIEVEYANSGAVQSIPAFAKADALLSPLLKHNGLELVRV